MIRTAPQTFSFSKAPHIPTKTFFLYQGRSNGNENGFLYQSQISRQRKYFFCYKDISYSSKKQFCFSKKYRTATKTFFFSRGISRSNEKLVSIYRHIILQRNYYHFRNTNHAGAETHLSAVCKITLLG